MEDINGTELKEFRLVLITLACQTWTLSCVFDRVPFSTSTLQATLTSFKTQLKKLSTFLLIDESPLKPSLEAWASLHRQKVYTPSQYGLAGARLVEIFRLFTPVYALCFALNDYNGRGGTSRKNHRCCWIAGGDTAMEISLADEAISKVFLDVAAVCENQLLNILSKFHLFTERMSGFYPNYSPPKTISSDMVAATPSTQVSECLIRMLQGDGRSFGGEVYFGTDPNKIVTAEYWIWGKEDGAWQLRVPNVVTLRLREIGKPGLQNFAGGEYTSEIIYGLCNDLLHETTIRWKTRRFERVSVKNWTLEDASAAGILLFSDVLRVSIGFARIKEKTIFLFEKCLVFARQKALEVIIVHRVFLSDLLQVRYRFEHPGKGSGVLTIYWREHEPLYERKVSEARLFFDNLSVLKIWAAFLAINASAEPSKGIFAPMEYKPWNIFSWNMPTLFGCPTVRGMVALMPEIDFVYGELVEKTPDIRL